MNLPVLLLMPAMAFIKDGCFEPKDEGICHRFSTRFYFNSVTGFCEKFTYGGCRGNRNNFGTEEACQQACTDVYPKECSLPLLPGDCDASLPRYYFNFIRGRCEKITDGRCGSNVNNFPTLELCDRKCLQPMPMELEKTRCHSKPDPGPCMAEMERFFYSPLTNNCVSFTYGGCGGNTNNYNDMDTCLSTCGKKGGTNVE